MRSPREWAGRLVAPAPALAEVRAALEGLRQARIVERIWQKDHTVWDRDPTDIGNRLGWLDVPPAMMEHIPAMKAFAAEVRAAGFRHVMVLGMGGSSLCPQVLHATFGSRSGYPELVVLDSTVPDRIRRATRPIDVAHTLFLVASKSGVTIEVMSFFKYFWALAERRRRRLPGEQFVAITDPGTRLAALAGQHGFRRTFLNPSDIGGRYSALSYFGLLPAALSGISLTHLLEPALGMMEACRTAVPSNPAAVLGAAMGALAKSGRNKLCVITSPGIAAFGLWAEQLVAESTGKDGQGLIPIALEPPVAAQAISGDRFFVVLRVAGDANASLDRYVADLAAAGHPLLHLELQDRFDLGAEFFRWELATAIAGHILGVHPFNQPDVKDSRDRAQRMLDRLTASETWPEPVVPRRSPASARLADFLQTARPGDYVALLAYLDDSLGIDAALNALRRAIVERFHLPTALGYGPRYLHSTGQLHKGGPDNGLFILFTGPAGRRLAVPGDVISFDGLVAAQAGGDLAALQARGRRIVHIDLGRNPAAGIRRLTQSIGGRINAQPQAARPGPAGHRARHRFAAIRRASRPSRL